MADIGVCSNSWCIHRVAMRPCRAGSFKIRAYGAADFSHGPMFKQGLPEGGANACLRYLLSDTVSIQLGS